MARRSIDQSKTAVNIPAPGAAIVAPPAMPQRPRPRPEIIRAKPAFRIR